MSIVYQLLMVLTHVIVYRHLHVDRESTQWPYLTILVMTMMRLIYWKKLDPITIMSQEIVDLINALFSDDLLWDGKDCGNDECDCRNSNYLTNALAY